MMILVPFLLVKAYTSFQATRQETPQIVLYIHSNCRGESIPIFMKDGIDLREKRSAGMGFELCKLSFPEDINAKDQVLLFLLCYTS
jgi:hypothetical protein